MMKVTIRADSVDIEGYVNAVGRDSRPLKDEYGYPFVEQIQPGTFLKALETAKREERAIEMLLDHDEYHKIGATDDNLELEEDSIGLYAMATVRDADTIAAAREKRLKGWSFGFRMLDFKEGYADGMSRRKITELELIEVSVIDDKMTPAYAGTSIHTRASAEDGKLFTRALEDEIQYEEDCAGATPEKGDKVTIPEDGSVGEQDGNRTTENPEPEQQDKPSDPEPVDLSTYRNRIKLLALG